MRIPFFQKKDLLDRFTVESYSQEGEDSILARIFSDQKKGCYVDVGAHHPKRFSNTYKFYKRGWRGINIDATPGSMALFKEIRPEDINLETPISDDEQELIFYMFNEPALNTFSAEIAQERAQSKNYYITGQVSIFTKRLENVLREHLQPGKSIQFLTVDAEGYDHKILMSNDWSRFRPEFVLFEGDPYHKRFVESDSYKFILGQDYEFIAKTVSTYFFKAV